MPAPEINEAIEKLGRTVEAFKAEGDKQVAEIKKFGASLSETDAKVERINAAISEQQDALAKFDDFADKIAADIARLEMGGGVGKGEEADKLEANARLFYGVMAAHQQAPVIRGDFGKDHVKAYGDYRKHFATYIRAGGHDGSKLTPDVQAAMRVGSDPDGGYWAPTEMLSVIQTRAFETSPMRQISQVITTSAESVEFPADTDDAVTGGWVGETASRAATATPQIRMQKITAHEQFANPPITQKLLDDAAFDVEGWLAGKINDKLGRDENAAFVTGNGVDKPRGCADYSAAAVTTADASRAWGLLQYVATGASAGFPAYSGTAADDASSLIDVIAALNPVYRQGAVWVMSRATEAAIRKLRDAEGRYLITYDLRDQALGFSLHGFPIVNFEDMAAIGANSFSAAFGNFRTGYMVVDRAGIRMLRDPYTNKPYVQFYTTKRTGGDVVNFDAIKLLKFGAS